MKKVSVLLVFFCSVSALHAQQIKDYRALDSIITILHNTDRFNGTVLYAEQGKVVYKEAFGVADHRTNQRLQTNSSFNLASISKQFICMGIMMLQEKGKLQYNDDCRKFLPELSYQNITIRNLMTHTSGIPEYFDLFQQQRTPLDTLTNEKLVTLFANSKPALDFATGSKWQYCNTNYVLLATIIERISKQPLNVFIQQNIIGPLGLKDSYVYNVLMPSVPGNHVYGFEETGDTRKLNDLTPFDGVTGDGNMYASVEDLFIWSQSLNTEKLVKKATMAEALTPVKLNDGSTYPYGFGWFIDKEKPGMYTHTGSWVGFYNVIFRDTQTNSTLIVLSSGSNRQCIAAAQQFMHAKPMQVASTFIINNVQLIDGTGVPARKAAVRIEGDKITAVGNLQPFVGEQIIDGGGKILAPGFIDSHSHLAGYLSKSPEALAALNQGVTTIVSGQDGSSFEADTLQAMLKRNPPAINVATYTGHASIREKVMGTDQLGRPATEAELEKIKILLQDDLKKGSLGLSTGLEYEAGFYSSREEVIELAKVAAAEKGKYISHLRSEDVNMKDALDEIIQIGRQAKLPVQISHIKIALKDDWGTAPTLLAMLQQARAEGIDITADCYPYTFWNSTLRVLFPKKDFTSLASASYATEHLFDPAGSVLVRFAPDTLYRGKTIAAIAAIRNETPAQTLLYLVAAAEAYEKKYPDANGIETIMGKSMSEKDLADFLSWGHTNVCSDGANGGHPRGYGSFTKMLNDYVRQQKIMTWEEAIRKMTGLSAEHTGIPNRGIIAAGNYADLVLIDPATVTDNASIENPKALSDGIEQVWVNGVLVYKNKQSLKQYPGVFVKKK